MSQINEGTIVLKKNTEPLFLADTGNECCDARDAKKVYEDGEYVIYVFDSNGDITKRTIMVLFFFALLSSPTIISPGSNILGSVTTIRKGET